MKVSVCCITYNHANFIAESIESFLMQHVDFEYEIVIGEDSSSDETRDIVECFQKKYPDKIFLLPSDKRYGMVENFKRTLRACKGEFIAVCEGDDYWTDPHKLIKQVEVLEQNRDLSFTFHDVNIVGFDGEVIGPLSKGRANMQLKNAVLDSRFVIGAPLRIVHLASLLFRKKLLDQDVFPAFMTDAPIADYPLVVMLADKGKAYYSDEIMAVYRLNLASISHQRTLDAELYNRIKKIYTELDKQFDYKYHKELMVGLKGHKIMQIEQKIRRAVRKKAYLSIFSGFAHLFLIHRHSQYSTRDLLWILRRFVRTGNYLLIFITSLNIYRTAITILPGKV